MSGYMFAFRPEAREFTPGSSAADLYNIAQREGRSSEILHQNHKSEIEGNNMSSATVSGRSNWTQLNPDAPTFIPTIKSGVNALRGDESFQTPQIVNATVSTMTTSPLIYNSVYNDPVYADASRHPKFGPDVKKNTQESMQAPFPRLVTPNTSLPRPSHIQSELAPQQFAETGHHSLTPQITSNSVSNAYDSNISRLTPAFYHPDGLPPTSSGLQNSSLTQPVCGTRNAPHLPIYAPEGENAGEVTVTKTSNRVHTNPEVPRSHGRVSHNQRNKLDMQQAAPNAATMITNNHSSADAPSQFHHTKSQSSSVHSSDATGTTIEYSSPGAKTSQHHMAKKKFQVTSAQIDPQKSDKHSNYGMRQASETDHFQKQDFNNRFVRKERSGDRGMRQPMEKVINTNRMRRGRGVARGSGVRGTGFKQYQDDNISGKSEQLSVGKSASSVKQGVPEVWSGPRTHSKLSNNRSFDNKNYVDSTQKKEDSSYQAKTHSDSMHTKMRNTSMSTSILAQNEKDNNVAQAETFTGDQPSKVIAKAEESWADRVKKTPSCAKSRVGTKLPVNSAADNSEPGDKTADSSNLSTTAIHAVTADEQADPETQNKLQESTATENSSRDHPISQKPLVVNEDLAKFYRANDNQDLQDVLNHADPNLRKEEVFLPTGTFHQTTKLMPDIQEDSSSSVYDNSVYFQSNTVHDTLPVRSYQISPNLQSPTQPHQPLVQFMNMQHPTLPPRHIPMSSTMLLPQSKIFQQSPQQIMKSSTTGPHSQQHMQFPGATVTPVDLPQSSWVDVQKHHADAQMQHNQYYSHYTGAKNQVCMYSTNGTSLERPAIDTPSFVAPQAKHPPMAKYPNELESMAYKVESNSQPFKIPPQSSMEEAKEIPLSQCITSESPSARRKIVNAPIRKDTTLTSTKDILSRQSSTNATDLRDQTSAMSHMPPVPPGKVSFGSFEEPSLIANSSGQNKHLVSGVVLPVPAAVGYRQHVATGLPSVPANPNLNNSYAGQYNYAPAVVHENQEIASQVKYENNWQNFAAHDVNRYEVPSVPVVPITPSTYDSSLPSGQQPTVYKALHTEGAAEVPNVVLVSDTQGTQILKEGASSVSTQPAFVDAIEQNIVLDGISPPTKIKENNQGQTASTVIVEPSSVVEVVIPKNSHESVLILRPAQVGSSEAVREQEQKGNAALSETAVLQPEKSSQYDFPNTNFAVNMTNLGNLYDPKSVKTPQKLIGDTIVYQQESTIPLPPPIILKNTPSADVVLLNVTGRTEPTSLGKSESSSLKTVKKYHISQLLNLRQYYLTNNPSTKESTDDSAPSASSKINQLLTAMAKEKRYSAKFLITYHVYVEQMKSSVNKDVAEPQDPASTSIETEAADARLVSSKDSTTNNSPKLPVQASNVPVSIFDDAVLPSSKRAIEAKPEEKKKDASSLSKRNFNDILTPYLDISQTSGFASMAGSRSNDTKFTSSILSPVSSATQSLDQIVCLVSGQNTLKTQHQSQYGSDNQRMYRQGRYTALNSNDDDDWHHSNSKLIDLTPHMAPTSQAYNMPEEFKKADFSSGKSMDRASVLQRKLRLILNKFTIEKFGDLYPQILTAGMSNEEDVLSLMNLIFSKAKLQHHFIPMYVDLCSRLNDDFPKLNIVEMHEDAEALKEKKKGCHGKFRRLLVDACEVAFKEVLEPIVISESLCEDDIFEMEVLEKKKRKGCMIFIAELCKRQMLAGRVVLECMRNLADQRGEAQLQALCELMNYAGAAVYAHSNYQKDIADIMQKVEALVKDKEKPLSCRIRFILDSVIEDFKTGFTKSSGEKLGPTNLDGFEQSTQHQGVTSHSTAQHNPHGDSSQYNRSRQSNQYGSSTYDGKYQSGPGSHSSGQMHQNSKSYGNQSMHYTSSLNQQYSGAGDDDFQQVNYKRSNRNSNKNRKDTKYNNYSSSGMGFDVPFGMFPSHYNQDIDFRNSIRPGQMTPGPLYKGTKYQKSNDSQVNVEKFFSSTTPMTLSMGAQMSRPLSGCINSGKSINQMNLRPKEATSGAPPSSSSPSIAVSSLHTMIKSITKDDAISDQMFETNRNLKKINVPDAVENEKRDTAEFDRGFWKSFIEQCVSSLEYEDSLNVALAKLNSQCESTPLETKDKLYLIGHCIILLVDCRLQKQSLVAEWLLNWTSIPHFSKEILVKGLDNFCENDYGHTKLDAPCLKKLLIDTLLNKAQKLQIFDQETIARLTQLIEAVDVKN